MTVGYSRPLSLAWQRMTGLLLRPFDLGRWFVLGFTAWLASFVEGSSGSSTLRWQEHLDLDLPDSPAAWPAAAAGAAERLADQAGTVVLVGVLVALALLVGLVLAWVGSRGQFMFLDNLVHRRTEVAAPWREYAREGDSLFLWQLVYWVVAMVLVGGLALGVLAMLGTLAAVEAPGAAFFAAFVALGTVGFVVVVVLAYVDFFLIRLVVPVMHRRRVPCTEAWRVFGAEFRRRPWPFVVYGLLHLGLNLAAAAVIVSAGLLTCCVGLLLLAVPYVGTVLTLPLPVFLRYLDLEWLGQFGPGLAASGPVDAGGASGQFEGDGAVVRSEDPGEDTGGGEPRPQDP